MPCHNEIKQTTMFVQDTVKEKFANPLMLFNEACKETESSLLERREALIIARTKAKVRVCYLKSLLPVYMHRFLTNIVLERNRPHYGKAEGSSPTTSQRMEKIQTRNWRHLYISSPSLLTTLLNLLILFLLVDSMQKDVADLPARIERKITQIEKDAKAYEKVAFPRFSWNDVLKGWNVSFAAWHVGAP